MHEKKHASRAQKKIYVDFAGREIDNESLIMDEYEENVLKEVYSLTNDTSDNWSSQKHKTIPNISADPNVHSIRPIYTELDTKNVYQPGSIFHDGLERKYNRVQDKELLEMQDMRQCLSMHQPFASLLVNGIKKFVHSKLIRCKDDHFCLIGMKVEYGIVSIVVGYG